MAQQPMYQQIAEDLRRKIETGVIERGAQLPTELALREEYDASRNTIRDAIKRLISQGLVETRPGQGTFVRINVDPFVTVLNAEPASGFGGGESATYLSQVSEEHRKPLLSVPKVEVQVPSPQVLMRLRLGPGTQVVSRHQERYIDDILWSLQTSFYPMDFVTKDGATRLLMAEDIAEGAVAYLAGHGHKQVGYRDWITARAPDENEQKHFSLAHDTSMFEIFRTAFDQDGVPMRVTVTVFPVDRNQFIVNVGENVPDPQYEELRSPPETQAGVRDSRSIPRCPNTKPAGSALIPPGQRLGRH
jgi:GntR family transcriptional regulator